MSDIEDVTTLIVDLEKKLEILNQIVKENQKQIIHLKVFMEAVYKILSNKKLVDKP